MRKRKDIEKEFKKRCSKLSKSDMNVKNLEAQKLILETLLDVRDLLQEFDLENYIEDELTDGNELMDGNEETKVGVTEEEIIKLYKENCHDKI